MSIKLTEGERVGELIKESGKTLTQVAAEIGIAQNRLSDWKNNKLKDAVRASTLKKACDYFQCSADYILGLSDVPRVAPNVDMIQKYTGLSFQAITLLHSGKEMADKMPKEDDETVKSNVALFIIDFLNQFFTSDELIGESGIFEAIALVKETTALIDNGTMPVYPLFAQEYINAGQYRASYEFSKFLERYFKPDIIKAEIIKKNVELEGLTETKEGL